MGVAKYNAECRKIVMRYSQQWEVIFGPHGRGPCEVALIVLYMSHTLTQCI